MQNTSPILVAGRAGQLARALEAVAHERRLPLVTAARPEFDIRDPASIDRIVNTLRPRAIVNAAAYTLVDKAESERGLAFKINRDGAAQIARVAARLHVPFIHVSTDYVFDGKKATPYQEHDIPSPLNTYGHSKRDGEIAVLNLYSAAVVLRTSWLYSPYAQNFLKTMLHLSQTRDLIRVVDDQYGAPTSARNLAQGIVEIVEQVESNKGESLGGVYHLTAAGVTTWYGFAEAIFSGWACRGGRVPSLEAIKTAEYPTPAQRPANSQLDCSKAARVFGVRLPPWREALEDCLNDLASNQTSTQSC